MDTDDGPLMAIAKARARGVIRPRSGASVPGRGGPLAFPSEERRRTPTLPVRSYTHLKHQSDADEIETKLRKGPRKVISFKDWRRGRRLDEFHVLAAMAAVPALAAINVYRCIGGVTEFLVWWRVGVHTWPQ